MNIKIEGNHFTITVSPGSEGSVVIEFDAEDGSASLNDSELKMFINALKEAKKESLKIFYELKD